MPGANKVWRALPGGRVARDWYAWRGKGAPQIARFEGDTRAAVIVQENSVEGAKVIAEGYARATHPSIDTRTLGGILDAWEASEAFRGRSESTKRNERGVLKDMRAAMLTLPNGQRMKLVDIPSRFLGPKALKPVRRDLRAWLESVANTNGPRAADVRKDILSKSMNWGKEDGLCEANVVEGIADFSHSDRSDIIWLGDDLQRFEAAGRAARRKLLKPDSPEPEEPPATTLALLLACYSGLRREDLCRLTDSHISEHALILKPLKSQRRARTAKRKAPADIIVPRTPELNAVLAVCLKVRARWEEQDQAKRVHVLLNSFGRSWSPAGLTSSFIKLRDEANIVHVYNESDRAPEPKTLHDARGTFVTHMRCLGYGKEEVAEMVGWETDDVDRVAKRYADADRIALAWLERIKRKAAG